MITFILVLGAVGSIFMFSKNANKKNKLESELRDLEGESSAASLNSLANFELTTTVSSLKSRLSKSLESNFKQKLETTIQRITKDIESLNKEESRLKTLLAPCLEEERKIAAEKARKKREEEEEASKRRRRRRASSSSYGGGYSSGGSSGSSGSSGWSGGGGSSSGGGSSDSW